MKDVQYFRVDLKISQDNFKDGKWHITTNKAFVSLENKPIPSVKDNQEWWLMIVGISMLEAVDRLKELIDFNDYEEIKLSTLPKENTTNGF